MTLDQERATYALAKVNAVKDADYKTEYRSYIRKFPTTVMRSGLGQALAMELAQGNGNKELNKGHQAVLSHVSEWLVGQDGWKNSPYRQNDQTDFINPKLIQAIMEGDEEDMIRAQGETMALLKWLKTFAEALIAPKDEGGQDDASATEE